jgi:succinoglycan biosynthesis protein ExoV
MNLFYFDPFHNFGDDLNRWIWEELLPGCWDRNDGVWFSGIGTTLNSDLMPQVPNWIVFGTGVGISAPPKGFGGVGWEVAAVRGPLSARALHLPDSAAVVDGAVLIRTLPAYSPLPESQRSGVVFMPHIESMAGGHWDEVCQRAGIEFLSPIGDSRKIAARIRSAKLVLADAMHGAIVADALRVPWVPLRSSDRINTFKWLDWTLSLRCPYQPFDLPPTSWLNYWNNLTLRARGENYKLSSNTAEAALKHFEAGEKLNRNFWWNRYRNQRRRILESIPARIYKSGVTHPMTASDRKKRIDRAAETLASVAHTVPCLSGDTILDERVRELRERLCTIPSRVRKLQGTSAACHFETPTTQPTVTANLRLIC